MRHLAEEHDELVMIVRGFERHMRRSPFDDDTIRDGLQSIHEHITVVLQADDDTTDAVSEV